MRWPLRLQILAPMAGILLLTIAIVSALNAWLATARVRRQLQSQLADVVRTFAGTNIPLTQGVLQQTQGLTGAEFVATEPGGRFVAASDELLVSAAAEHGPQAAPLDLSAVVRVQERTYFHAAALVDRRSAQGGQYVLHVFYPEAQWREARWQAAWPPLALGGVAFILVAAAAYLVAAHVTQPIERLRSQVGAIAGGDFTPLPLPARDDEIRGLAAAVNQMAQRLEKYEQAARQSERLQTLGTLGGGIAHQIRNAATGCRIALDLHERDLHEHNFHGRDCPLAASNGHSDEPLAVAVRQLGLIEQHIQQFLMLGRPATGQKQPTSLADLVRQALELVRPSAAHLGVELQFASPDEAIVVDADGPALVQLLVNLLVNGIEAAAQARVAAGAASAGAGRAVSVRLTRIGERCELAVVDPGPGPSARLQPRLFEPFATDKPGGTGLGLAVARRIAEDHDGAIRWERRGAETWFLVELPLHAALKECN